MADCQLIGTKEAAAYLGFSQEWLQRNTRRLAIPHRRINRHFYYVVGELAEWVDSQKLAAESSNPYHRVSKPLRVKLASR